MRFESFAARCLQRANPLVMAPLPPSRATPEHLPTPLVANDDGLRAEAGPIITEGTSPIPDEVGDPRIP
jgi:N-ethylmaleimide reductase